MNPVKLPQMNSEEIDGLIGSQKICRIAMNRGDYPYLAPFRYVVKDNVLYFHFTNYGRKMELLKKEQKVCVQIDNYTPDLSSYRFVSLCGTLEKVTDTTEYGLVVKIFSDTGKKDLSAKFLAAHGLSVGEGWEAFTANKEMIFMKLANETPRFGLKSP
jgi:hypothetical protein